LEGKGMEKEEPDWTGVGASGSELEMDRELEGWWETETEIEEPGKYEEALVEMERAAPEEERSLERAESTERRPAPQEFWLLRRVQKVPAGNFLVEVRRVSAIAWEGVEGKIVFKREMEPETTGVAKDVPMVEEEAEGMGECSSEPEETPEVTNCWE